MFPAQEYELRERLRFAEKSHVYTAIRKADRRNVVIKIYPHDRAVDDGSQAQHEFELLRRLAAPGLPEALAIERSGERPALVLEELPGTNLKLYAAGRPLPIDLFLDVAQQIVHILQHIHAARIVHRDLNPSNLMLEPQSRRAWIIDLGIAIELGHIRERGRETGLGTLAYIAPEQTGRMDCGVDHRSDLYSLGVTFYELLVGRPPFDLSDPLELIHAHIARVPEPVQRVNPAVPAVLSQIVAKLLEKSPERRYESCAGLAFDLALCAEQWQRFGRIDPELKLGSADALHRLQFREDLYGRDREFLALRRVLDVASTGSPGLVLIGGAPGVGKSVLAAQLQPLVVERGGYFARGSFDAYRRDQSMLGFRTAFESLAEQLLTESSARVQLWSARLLSELGGLARVVVDLVPSLEPLLPGLEPVPGVGPEQSLRRRISACERFVRVFAQESHPLVLVLDDCHGADPASLQLLEALLAPLPRSHLLIVGTYPDSDRARLQGLQNLSGRLTALGRPYSALELGPLPFEEVHAWTSDLLGRPRPDTLELAQRVSRTTGNNPFLMRQYMTHLCELGLLLPGAAGEGWRWDPAAVDAVELPDDVASILTSKITALPDASRHVLRLASCLGEVLDVDALVELAELDETVVRDTVTSLCEAGLLAARITGLRFAHGRIREAARELLSAEELASLHRQIGSRLLASTPELMISARVTEIMAHLNQAADLVPASELPRMVDLNLLASRQALASGSPSSASQYLTHARAFFREEDWPQRPNVGFDVYYNSAEAAYAEGRCAEALEFLAALEHRPLDLIQLARMHGRRAAIRAITEGIDQGMLDALAGMRKLGLSWSPGYSRRTLYWSILRSAWDILRMGEKGLRRRGLPSNPRDLGQTILFAYVAMTSYRYSVSLFAQVTAGLIRMQRVYGLPSDTGATLFGFAHLQTLLTGNFRLAQRIARLGRRIADQSPDRRFRPMQLIVEHLVVMPWSQHRRKSLEPLRQAEQLAEELGEVEHMLYAAFYRALLLYFVGEPLPIVIDGLQEIARRYRPLTGRDTHEPLIEALSFLREEKPLDEGAVFRSLTQIDPNVGPMVTTVWMGVLYVLKQFDRALQTSDTLLGDLHKRIPSLPHVPEFWFMRGLSAAALLRPTRGRERRRLLGHARQCLRKLRRFAHYGPENLAHQVLMLEAELGVAAGHGQRALALYREATERAQSQGYHHHAAIALERRAELCLMAGLPHEAAHDLSRALSLYANWGGRAKTAQLQQHYRELLQDYAAPAGVRMEGYASVVTTPSGGHASGSSNSMQSVNDSRTLDMTALLRASEALSGELELDRVLDRVMGVAIEMAGAQRAVLLLQSPDGLRVEAERALQGETVRSRDRLPLLACADRLPTSLIQYVERSRKLTVLGHAAREGLFQDDPYVRTRRSTSILCLPILRQARLVGVLYLENDLAPNAFKQSSADVLGLLSTHAAISLDNARLYDELRDLNLDLERRVDLRTEELRGARDAARAADRAKSEFLAVMSHEIRTPMNVVIGMSQLLDEMQLSPDQRECVHAVRTAGSSLLTLINDILDSSKIEAGKLELEAIPFHLRECVEEVVEILAPKANQQGLELPVFIDRELPEAIIGDPVRLKQVLTNFVSNALKFTERGEVAIELRPGQLDPSGVRVEVRDTGIGIPADRIDKLFQKFSQVDVSTTRRYGGTGLGLAISKGLVDAMRGQVGVRSTEGQGTTFWFEIPLTHAQLPTTRPELPLPDLRIAILMEHAASGEGVREHIRCLGGDAEVCTHEAAARNYLEGAARPVLMLRHPLEHPEWGAFAAQLATQAGASVIRMPTLQERAEAAAASPRGSAHVLTWPIRDRGLRQTLAICLGRADAEQESQAGGPARVRAPGRAARIIVAEDYPLNQKLIARLLERLGYSCDMVDNGALLLEATQARNYDVALVDCQMPVVDGFEATRRIREREAQLGERLPIIAMTANAMKGDRERCLECGMDDYLSKPLHLDTLRRTLERYLDK